ncbi:interleukin-12 subunit alpha [Misgurnus anguillicaudatus]|uniref:interleukin-12 subunit alpha n=1 Tax=Misgurnus anguillicaudatus TaxID=75329 RepID=UPI003CCF1F84
MNVYKKLMIEVSFTKTFTHSRLSSRFIMKYLIVFSVVVALVTGTPVPSNIHKCTDCSKLARSLLTNLSHVMDKGPKDNENLFAGFNCTELAIQMNEFTQTGVVCQPNTSPKVSCVNQRNSTFSETECLRNIRDDLCYYNDLLNSYMKNVKQAEKDLNPVVNTSKDLVTCLQQSYPHVSAERTLPKGTVWVDLPFGDRVSLCKKLKGFHVRAITINRALSYIASGDHRK